MKTNSYYRGRLAAVYSLIASLNGHAVHDDTNDRKRNSDRELLKMGYVVPSLSNVLEAEIVRINTANDSPLTFTELATFNTWFEMHPEKVCGDLFVSTSLSFPLQLKGGSREYVERKVRASLKQQIEQRSGQRVAIIKAKMKMQLSLALALEL